MNPYKNIDLEKLFNSIPPELIEDYNQKLLLDTKNDFEDFVNKLKQNISSICGQDILNIDINNPCVHWFSHPSIKKKEFDSYLSMPLSYFDLEGYFRWLANTENPLININDLSLGTSRTCRTETTIKFREFEWSISVGFTDIEGHPNAKMGNTPHYHIQVIRNGQIFIRYNDYHIRFTDDDLLQLKAIDQNLMVYDPLYGSGVSYLDNDSNLEAILGNMQLPNNEDDGLFKMQTMIMTKDNSPIDTSIINEANRISQETKVPMGIVAKKLLTQAGYKLDSKTILTSIKTPEKAKRSGKK